MLVQTRLPQTREISVEHALWLPIAWNSRCFDLKRMPGARVQKYLERSLRFVDDDLKFRLDIKKFRIDIN